VPPRVVSLVPSVTETLIAWGVTPVGVTRYCEQPGIPAVGGTKDPDLRKILALAPEVVVLDREENRREDHDALVEAGLAVHVTDVRSVLDVPDELLRLAERLGVVPFDEPRLPPMRVPGRRVFVPIWKRPLMSINGDTYGSTLLAAVGLANVLAGHPDRYPTVAMEEVAALRPELVLLPTEPYPFAPRHLAEFEDLGVPVELVDGEDVFWWGVRTPGALERLGDRFA